MKRAGEEMEAVYVHGEQKRWSFESGIAVAEALDYISMDTEISARLLVLESKAGTTDIVRRRDAKLVAGNEYRVRVRNEAFPKRRFAAGVAVDPVFNYYVSPNVDGLVSDLVQGKYCVLCGPRQSGKSTMVMAARRKLLLQSAANVVYLDGLEGANKEWSSVDLWGYLCDSLTLKCPSLFPKQEAPHTALVFKSLFSGLPCPVTLVLDEADTLLELQPDVISQFFATIRAMKNDSAAYSLHGFLLVGVETVKDLLQAQYDKHVDEAKLGGRDYITGSTPSRLSPFPHDHVLPSSRFTLEDVKDLLQQAAAERPKVEIDVDRIATSLFQWTAGHKGLTGTCLAYLVQEELWTFKRWTRRAESYRLGTYIFGQATYSRILDFIRRQERFSQASELLIRFLETPGLYCGPERLVQLRDYIAHGVLAASEAVGAGSDEDESEAEAYYVCISTPLLRTAMLRRCVVSCNEVDPPPSATHLDRKWLILQAIKTLDGDVMCRPECLRAGDAGPAEYAHQFLFLCRLKAILRHAYPSIRVTVLPEVKEEMVPGQKRSQLRCDSLVRDGPNFAKFGAELVANGSWDDIVKHIERAVTYQEQHSAQVFVINFCMNRSTEHIVTPSHDSLVFVSVNFRPSSKEATVTFVDSSGRREVHVVALRNWEGFIAFEDV